MAYYFLTPFGTSGDKTAIPVAVQGDGSISYTQGYGPNYSAPRDTDPAALTIERNKMNQLFYAITANLQQYQQHGVPEYITSADNGGSAYGYSKYAQVRYDNGSEVANYISLVASNTALPTDNTKWAQIRIDPAYLGVAQTFTAVQTFGTAGTPVIINSTNSTALKLTLKDNGTNRGGIGASSAWSHVTYLADLTTAVGGWDASGHLIPGAAATYDLGSASAQYRAAYANRYEVLGGTAPAAGMYLQAAGTVGISATSLPAATFRTSGTAVNWLEFVGTATGTGPIVSAVGGDTNLSIQYCAKGAGVHDFFTNGTSSSVRQLQIYHTASAVNYWLFTGSVTAAATTATSAGTDTNINMTFAPKGTGEFRINTNTGGAFLARFIGVASTVNYFQFTGAATTGTPKIAAVGSDTNVGLNIATQGVGALGLFAGTAQTANFRASASAVNYFDFLASAATGLIQLSAQGGDTNLGIAYISKGTGSQNFYSGGSTSDRQFQILANAGAVNFQRVVGSVTGSPTVWSNSGTDTDIGHDFKIQGAGTYRFFSAAGTDRQFQITATASAVNYWQATGSATGNSLGIGAQGSDTNVNAILYSKGTGEVRLNSNGGGSFLARFVAVASTANYLQFTAAAAAASPVLAFVGSDTNVGGVLSTQGTGSLSIQNGNGQSAVFLAAASAVNYMQIQGNALGNPPTIAALGNDTNIHFFTVSKGTGVLTNLGSFTNGSATSANLAIDSSGHIFKNTSQGKYKPVSESIDPERAIEIVEKLNPIWYRSSLPYDQQDWRKGWSYYGLIAEEAADVDPRLAIWDREFLDEYDAEGQPIMGEKVVPTGVTYDKIGLFAIVAFRAQIAKLQAEVAALKARN